MNYVQAKKTKFLDVIVWNNAYYSHDLNDLYINPEDEEKNLKELRFRNLLSGEIVLIGRDEYVGNYDRHGRFDRVGIGEAFVYLSRIGIKIGETSMLTRRYNDMRLEIVEVKPEELVVPIDVNLSFSIPLYIDF